MRNFIILGLMALFILPTHDLAAQSIRNRIKRKLNERIDRKVEEKVDEKIDDALDKILSGDSKEGTADSTRKQEVNVKVKNHGDEVNITIGADDTAPADVKPSEFIGYYTMEYRSYKNGKEEKDSPSTISYYMDTYRFAMKPQQPGEDEQITMIMDRGKRKMINKIIDEDGNKTAMILPMIKIGVKVNTDAQSTEQYSTESANVQATGRSKTIHGYLCKEYKVENEEGTTLVWITNGTDLNMAEMLSFINVQASGSGSAAPSGQYNNVYSLGGFPMESHFTDKKGKQKTSYQIKEFKKGSVPAEIFSLSGYEVQDVSSMLRRD
ncbi:MAG: DUF4412 domain-containing protein [Bacteroidota bacterium]